MTNRSFCPLPTTSSVFFAGASHCKSYSHCKSLFITTDYARSHSKSPIFSISHMKPPPAEKSIIPSIPPLCPSENLKKSAIPKNRQKKIQFEFLSPPVSNIDFRPLSPLPLSQQPQINMFYKKSFPHQELITIIPLLQPQIAPTNRFPTSPAPNRLSPPPVPSSPPSFNQYSSNFKYLKKKITILHSLFPPKKDI